MMNWLSFTMSVLHGLTAKYAKNVSVKHNISILINNKPSNAQSQDPGKIYCIVL